MDTEKLYALASLFCKFADENIQTETDYQDIDFEQFKLASAKQYIKNNFPDTYDTLWDEEGQEIHFDDEESEQLANESREEILHEIYKDNDFRELLKGQIQQSHDAGALEFNEEDLESADHKAHINWFGESDNEYAVEDLESPDDEHAMRQQENDKRYFDEDEIDMTTTDLDSEDVGESTDMEDL